MTRWWRAYDGAVDDPKLCLLSDRAHRGWFNLMCVASENGGALPAMDVLHVKLRLPVKKIEVIISELLARELLDDVEGVLRPHNWASRQFQSDVSTERVKRHREQRRNVSSAVSVTPPETETDRTDSEAEKKKKEPRASALDVDFEAWWEIYPHKVGKQAARKAYEKARKSGVSQDILIAALLRYAAKTDDRAWCNPATWLNEGRWEDRPATQVARQNGHAPRPGSREDRQERTANALEKLSQYVDAGADESRAGSEPGEEIAGFLPFPKSA